MAGQNVILWSGAGGGPPSEKVRRLAAALPIIPPPAPLQRSALVDYRWGKANFNIVVTACSLRTTPWGDGEMIWLSCKGMNAAEIKEAELTGVTRLLIPAAYVTAISAGGKFQLRRTVATEDLAVFPPSHPPPRAAVPLAEIERVITELLALERN